LDFVVSKRLETNQLSLELLRNLVAIVSKLLPTLREQFPRFNAMLAEVLAELAKCSSRSLWLEVFL